jgi:probable phosphoglycerate mutase
VTPETLEVWVVRHGETPRSRDRLIAGWADIPLTPRGREQARQLRPVLEATRFDGVWSSDLARAVETARLAWGEPQQERRIREMNFGALEGLPWATLDPLVRSAIERFEDFTAPGGESVAGLRARVAEFLGSLPPGRHLVFTHSGVVRTVGREVGEDAFVATGTVLAVDWARRALLFKRDGRTAR